jgi:hypothetical protein
LQSGLLNFGQKWFWGCHAAWRPLPAKLPQSGSRDCYSNAFGVVPGRINSSSGQNPANHYTGFSPGVILRLSGNLKTIAGQYPASDQVICGILVCSGFEVARKLPSHFKPKSLSGFWLEEVLKLPDSLNNTCVQNAFQWARGILAHIAFKSGVAWPPPLTYIIQWCRGACSTIVALLGPRQLRSQSVFI